MKKLLLLSTVLFSISAIGQNILITDADLDTLNPYNCANSAPDANFFDSGNNTANYGDNESETITVCPQYVGTNNGMVLTFGVNAGLAFDVDASDSIYVYDGLNTSAPLLGIHNSSNSPTGFNYTTTFENNPTGCLTVQFESDGATNAAGWEANISCITLPQPFTTHMTCQVNGSGPDVITPSDTGYIDICYGDSLLFTASADFPYSSDVTGYGYSQTENNVTYEWTFSDGTLLTGQSVYFNPPLQNGYLVTLKITDSFGQSETLISKVRVSTTPTFTGVLINRDSICIGDTTLIVGGVTLTDTVGVATNGGSFELGGSIAGLVYLPDGSGVNYTDTMSIFGFLPGQTLANPSDISQLFLNIEHSYLGDLEMTLTCPNGTEVTIFNSYSPGMIPGGFDGGGTFLGNAYDMNIGNPGVGMEYYFSTSNATWGTMAAEYNNNNTVNVNNPSNGNAMNPNGIYLPEESFGNFAGCPLNGDWVITVRDNLGTDDGYIFEWGLFFDPGINPNTETYLPSIASSQWLSNATILPGNPTDTFIVVSSDLPGVQQYTYEVVDNFGCAYDTIVPVYFLPTPTTMADATACGSQQQITGTTSYDGGVWTYTGPGTANFSASNTVENPNITVSENGTYLFTFTDNTCGNDTSVTIYFADSVFVDLPETTFCIGDVVELSAYSDVTEATYLWNTGSTDASINITTNGEYNVVVTGLCNSATDTIVAVSEICDIIPHNVITPNGDGQNDILYFTRLDRYPNSKLVVFNRWGNKVYENNNYQNDWSPTDLSDGTYFYVLTPGEGTVPAETISQTFTILK